MEVTLSGIVTEVSDEQPENASVGMEVIEEGSTIFPEMPFFTILRISVYSLLKRMLLSV